jgi:hypothetical protein
LVATLNKGEGKEIEGSRWVGRDRWVGGGWPGGMGRESKVMSSFEPTRHGCK